MLVSDSNLDFIEIIQNIKLCNGNTANISNQVTMNALTVFFSYSIEVFKVEMHRADSAGCSKAYINTSCSMLTVRLPPCFPYENTKTIIKAYYS